ncbi:MAG: metallophosphoesterase [Synergistaceae bacterium]|nr:metallophosphoesterase [Synergistaceae bacterium]
MIRHVLVFLAVTNFYVYWKLRSGFGGGWWGIAYLSWVLALAVLPFAARMGVFGAGRGAEVLFALSFIWVAAVGMACVGFFFMDVLWLAAYLADGLLKLVFGTGPNLRLAPRRCVPVTLCLITAAVLYSFYEAWNVRRVNLTLETAKLPAGVERLRLVHLTDVHIGGLYTPERLARVMDIVRAAEPDLLLVTGDLADGNMSFRGQEAEMLAAHGAKYGAFAVTGNHESYVGFEQAMEFIKRAGLTLIRNDAVSVAGITLIGLDDPTFSGSRGFFEAERLPEGLTFPSGRFVVLLKHRPRVIEGTEGLFDLQLSGHTHGGQIWPFSYVVQWVHQHTQHLSRKGSSAVYISNGAGFWGPPMRFLAPPEVTVIDLVREGSGLKEALINGVLRGLRPLVGLCPTRG